MAYFRNEYPRPQFKRDDWFTLNGEWEFAFDDNNEGLKKGYHTGKKSFNSTINVPFTYQYEASGIGDLTTHETVWYKRTFKIENNRRALLCFNGADYKTEVWVNGYKVITHTGAFAPFYQDVTDYIKKGENVLVVRCEDPLDPTIPRGKQSWTGERFGCWYIPNTGIWQSVWMEFFDCDAISEHTLTPDPDTCSFYGEITTLYGKAEECEITVTFRDKQVKKVRFSLDGKHTRYAVKLMELDFVDESFLWSPERPNLFYADFKLYKDGKQIDLAHTRFGLRKVSIDAQSGKICLNNRPLYQRLILDQGYWPESGLTPPSVEAIRKDIELCMAMGFNGARKHQKFEDPYFYYLAEEMGYLTWCEMPSAYNFNADEVYYITKEWQEILKVGRNFTSNICYVPLNESWGVRKIVVDKDQQNFARSLYYLTKAIDSSRLISTNDGWENVDKTDILSIHDYAFSGKKFPEYYVKENYESIYPQGRKLTCSDHVCSDKPALFTEFGGIAMRSEEKNGNWGYNTGAENEEDFLARYGDLMKGIYATESFQGFCYTQVSDVQQEVNGLLTADRKAKFSLEKIKKLTLNVKE